MGNSCRGSLGDKEVNSLNQPKNGSGNGELPDQQPSSGGRIDNLNHPRKVTSEEPSKHLEPQPETVVENDDTMNRNTTANQGLYVIGHKT
ncbi:putative non-specific serine/threonine protein kinase [Helianthus anomalus]